MTKVTRMLAGGGLAAVLGMLLFGVASVFSASDAAAESPPAPPARFGGSVTVDGAPVPAGTRIEARIGSATCGVTTTFNSGAEARYILDVPALDPGATPNCGAEGAVVSFWIGDKQARETGSWVNYDLNVLNLSYVTPTETPSASPSASPTGTPRPPVTGTLGEVESGTGASTWLFVALGAGALAFGAAGATVARRSR